MKQNFDGYHFMIPSIPGRNQPKLDCMFFPSTSNEKVDLEPSNVDLIRSQKGQNPKTRKYLQKSTIIMCNPNALTY